MALVEYIQSNKLIGEELRAISNIGVGSTDPSKALAERVHALRTFIAKWDGIISPNFLRPIRDMIQEAMMYGGGMPQMPDARSHVFNTPNGLQAYLSAMHTAWNDLIAFKDREAKGFTTRQGDNVIDKFVAMTAKIEGLILPHVDLKRIPRSNRNYMFTSHPDDWPGRLIAQVDFEKDIVYFRELARSGKNQAENIARFRVFATRDEAIAAGTFKYRTHAGEIKASNNAVIAPAKEKKDILNALKEDEILIHNKVFPAEIYNGVLIPLPDSKGNRYGKTILSRASRECRKAMAEKMLATKEGAKPINPEWKMDEFSVYIAKTQKKRDLVLPISVTPEVISPVSVSGPEGNGLNSNDGEESDGNDGTQVEGSNLSGDSGQQSGDAPPEC